METLLRDLLSYTQVTKLEEHPALSSAAEALESAIANLAPMIAETGARVTSESLPGLPVHATHLQQLFQNLVGNALKYRSADRSPVVHVKAERLGGSWMLAVQDNGIGIDAEYKETIFGLFKRLHNADDYPGTGIGLAICKRIVDRYHGRIWVESEPGRGSTFCFTIPG
jgi:light-regulated signal transduction histidine kinase (bacteriophytochrome)